MFARYSVLNLPSLPPSPAPEMGCGGGDRACRSKKNKESPPWVCEKCAKKTAEEKRRGLQGDGLGCPKCEAEKLRKKPKPGMTSESTLDLGRRTGGIGCGYESPEDVEMRKRSETSQATLDLGRLKSNGHSIGCGYEGPEGGEGLETSESTLDLGCDKCQRGKKRRQAAARNRDLMPSGWLNLQGAGMLGQVPLRMQGGGHGGRSVPYARNGQDETWDDNLDLGRQSNGMLGQVRLLGNGGRGGGRAFGMEHDDESYRYCDPSREICPTPFVGPIGIGRTKRCTGVHKYMGQTYGCPASAPAVDPTLNCQRDARGNAVCSNGQHYPPGCPHTPPEEYFSPGIAPDEVHGSILEAKIPAPRSAGTTGASGVPAADAAPGAAPAAAGSTNILPLAAGGIAVVGLLYAILR